MANAQLAAGFGPVRPRRLAGASMCAVPLLAVAILLASPAAAVTHPTHDAKVVLFGNLHAHSSLSDDVSGGADLLPAKAFAYAHQQGLDFLAITDHHKAVDSPGIQFRLTDSEYEQDLYGAAVSYNEQHPGKFIAVPGFEWGNTATGNHVNVFGADELPPDYIEDAEYDDLLQWAANHADAVQFNHPYSWKWKTNRDQDVGNFGEALYSSSDAFVSAVDPIVKTVSIICSIKGGHLSGEYRDSHDKTHRDMSPDAYSYFMRFLNMGFHISPAANQDTHRDNWGAVTAARTAVWADAPTYEGLIGGLKANRVYATEDDEMVVAFQAKYQGGTYWMGDSVPLQQVVDDVELVVKVWQSTRSDAQLADEGPYTIQIISDPDGVGGSEASVWDTVEDVPAGQLTPITVPAVVGEYLYLKVSEQNGKDNPVGEGEDESDNETHALGADGKRDNMDDDAWTSPIWFVGETHTYVWSKNSNLYHDPDCWVVPRIGAANRRSGPAPAGKTKHDCHP